MTKQTVMWSFNEILFSNTKEQTDLPTTWRKLKNVMLSERSQTPKIPYCIAPPNEVQE